VAFAMIDAGLKPKGIRLDSGDLVQLSIKSKQMFKKYGDILGKDTSYFTVVASNDINEGALLKFVE
jgi:nicotinate phosphoribosyltransferase